MAQRAAHFEIVIDVRPLRERHSFIFDTSTSFEAEHR
jgi:hypothetical protein